ncbi:hypothetical protein AAVH_21532 [Aphelenchoides avenae]|nr:hypothetical protein AAVH_21532 [Aphelenchus avenae]
MRWCYADPYCRVTSTIPPISGELRDKWHDVANEVAKKVIGEVSESVHANTWEKRSKELHPAITAALGGNLTDKYKKFSNKNITFYSVAMLTYNDNGKSCKKSNEDSVYGTHEHVTYLAQPDFGDKLRPYKTDLLGKYEQKILDKTFSSTSNDLCETAAMALQDVLGLRVNETASALVAVACGYKFVWYELGYAYFPAANSTSPYTLTTRQNSDYSSKCGQIVLFP